MLPGLQTNKQGIILFDDIKELSTVVIPNNKHFIRHFLDIKKAKSIHTADCYERNIKAFFGVNDICDITIYDIIKVTVLDCEQWIITMLQESYSSATIGQRIASLSSLYTWLLKYQDNASGKVIIRYNPFASLKDEKPNIQNEDTGFLTEPEAKRLINSFDTDTLIGLRNKALVALAITTALRKSEIINIRIKDMIQINGIDVIKVLRKGKKKSYVKLQAKVKEYIIEYIIKSGRNIINDAEQFLFMGHSSNGLNSEKFSKNALNKMIAKACKSVCINKKIGVHSLRHTSTTLALEKGESLAKVRDFADHNNIATTNRYLHSLDKLKNNAGDSLADLV